MLRLLLQHWQSSSLYQSPQKKPARHIPVPLAFSDDVTKVNPIFQDDSDTAASTLSYKRARHNILADVHHDPDTSSLELRDRISYSNWSDPDSGSDSTTERKSFLHSYRGSPPGSLNSNSGSPDSNDSKIQEGKVINKNKIPNGTSKSPGTKQVGTSNLLVTDPTPLLKEYAKELTEPDSGRPSPIISNPSNETAVKVFPTEPSDSVSSANLSQPKSPTPRIGESDRSKAPDLASFIPPPPPLPSTMTNKSSLLATISEKSDSGTSKPSTPVPEPKTVKVGFGPPKEPIPISHLFKASLGETRNLKPSEILRQQRGYKDSDNSPTTSRNENQLRDALTKELANREKASASRETLTKESANQSTSRDSPKDLKPKDLASTEPKKLLVMMNEIGSSSFSSNTNVKTQTEVPSNKGSTNKVSEPVTTSTVEVENSGTAVFRAPSEKEDPVRKITEVKPSTPMTSAGKKKKGGVTRGDQVPSDEGASTTSSYNSSESASKKDVVSDRTRRLQKSNKNCRNCGGMSSLPASVPSPLLLANGKVPAVGKVSTVPGTRQRLSPVGLAKFDDYYLTAIRQARRTRSSDSLSDSLATYDNGSDRKLCNGCHRKIRKGRYKTNAEHRYPPEGSAHDASDSFFSEDYFSRPNNPFIDPRSQRYRRSSWASCSCDQCSDGSFNLDQRSRSFGGTDSGEIAPYRKSFGMTNTRSPSGHHHTCTCSQAVTSRRVKFASAGSPPEDSKDSKEKEKKDETEAKPEAKDESSAKSGEQLETKNGFAKSLQSGFTPFPWEAEDWQSFLRKKSLQRRRRRALYMGLTALVLVVLVGMAVGLVLVWLRRAK